MMMIWFRGRFPVHDILQNSRYSSIHNLHKQYCHMFRIVMFIPELIIVDIRLHLPTYLLSWQHIICIGVGHGIVRGANVYSPRNPVMALEIV